MDVVKRLVSITITFYNSEDFLSEAIESVLTQTYTHWELFLVDDGSTDRSAEIARNYAARFPQKITCLEHSNHENHGISCSRNLGARNGRGEFLAFLDSDDVWLPEKLQDQVALMNAHTEAGLVYGSSEWWYDWEGSTQTQQRNRVPKLAPGGKLYYPPTLLTATYPLGTYGAPCPSSFLLRRTAFERVGGFEECFRLLYEDIAFLTKIYCTAAVFVSNACWDRYRCHGRSVWKTGDATGEESGRKYYFLWLRSYIKQHIDAPHIFRAIRRKAWQYWLPLPPRVTRLIRRAENRLSMRGV